MILIIWMILIIITLMIWMTWMIVIMVIIVTSMVWTVFDDLYEDIVPICVEKIYRKRWSYQSDDVGDEDHDNSTKWRWWCDNSTQCTMTMPMWYLKHWEKKVICEGRYGGELWRENHYHNHHNQHHHYHNHHHHQWNREHEKITMIRPLQRWAVKRKSLS